jgi:hypothetical protein
MAKADLEMALVKAQGRSPLSPEEMLELLMIDVGTLITEHSLDLYQAEEVMMWRKHEALRYQHQFVSYPPGELKEAKKLSIRGLNKMILSGKKSVIKEAISPTPSGRVEVEWDFETDDEEWNALSYEEKVNSEGLPPVIDIDPDLMIDYQRDTAEYGEGQADDMINDWLSDEFGWLHQGWSWV